MDPLHSYVVTNPTEIEAQALQRRWEAMRLVANDAEVKMKADYAVQVLNVCQNHDLGMNLSRDMKTLIRLGVALAHLDTP